MEPCGIALTGCGTVGSGVAQLLLDHAERITARAGRPLELRRIVIRDPSKTRTTSLPFDLLTTNLRSIVEDPKVHVVAELAGGIEFPRRAILDLLSAGKDVVTANKALLAEH